jgi:hypothetical protein
MIFGSALIFSGNIDEENKPGKSIYSGFQMDCGKAEGKKKGVGRKAEARKFRRIIFWQFSIV